LLKGNLSWDVPNYVTINDVHDLTISTNVMGICATGDWWERNTDLLQYRRGQRREERVHGTTTPWFLKVPTETLIYAGWFFFIW
jgi:hypothetical protein